MKNRLTLFATLLWLTSHVYAQTIVPAMEDTIQLGMPYNKHSYEFYNFTCVKSDNGFEYGQNNNFEIETYVDLSLEQATKATSGSLGAGVDVPIVKLNGGIATSRQHSSDDLSQSITIAVNWSPSSKLLSASNRSMTPRCAALSEQSELREIARDIVGTGYVSQINYGVKFLATLKIDFNSQRNKEKLSGNLSIDSATGVLNFSGDLDSVDSETLSSTNISITVEQEGGLPSELLKVIPAQTANCAFSDWTTCKSVMEQLFLYASSGDLNTDPRVYNNQEYSALRTVKSLREQINSEPDSANVISYVVEDYEPVQFPNLIEASSSERLVDEYSYYQTIENLNSDITTAISYASEVGRIIDQAKSSNYSNGSRLNDAMHQKTNAIKRSYLAAATLRSCLNTPYSGKCESDYHNYKSDAQLNYPITPDTLPVLVSLPTNYELSEVRRYNNEAKKMTTRAFRIDVYDDNHDCRVVISTTFRPYGANGGIISRFEPGELITTEKLKLDIGGNVHPIIASHLWNDWHTFSDATLQCTNEMGSTERVAFYYAGWGPDEQFGEMNN